MFVLLHLGPCCSKMCKYEGPAVVCSVTNGCTKNTSCSGHSFSCDPPEPLKNGTLCDEGRRLCYSGQCSTSVCHRYGLVECSCEVESELCDLCCKEVGGACTSAKRLTQVIYFLVWKSMVIMDFLQRYAEVQISAVPNLSLGSLILA